MPSLLSLSKALPPHLGAQVGEALADGAVRAFTHQDVVGRQLGSLVAGQSCGRQLCGAER